MDPTIATSDSIAATRMNLAGRDGSPSRPVAGRLDHLEEATIHTNTGTTPSTDAAMWV